MTHNQFIELLDLRYSAFVDLPELNGVQYSVIEIKDQNSFLILQKRYDVVNYCLNIVDRLLKFPNSMVNTRLVLQCDDD